MLNISLYITVGLGCLRVDQGCKASSSSYPWIQVNFVNVYVFVVEVVYHVQYVDVCVASEYVFGCLKMCMFHLSYFVNRWEI